VCRLESAYGGELAWARCRTLSRQNRPTRRTCALWGASPEDSGTSTQHWTKPIGVCDGVSGGILLSGVAEREMERVHDVRIDHLRRLPVNTDETRVDPRAHTAAV